jgi:hypothetical protein
MTLLINIINTDPSLSLYLQFEKNVYKHHFDRVKQNFKTTIVDKLRSPLNPINILYNAPHFLELKTLYSKMIMRINLT